MLRFDLPGRAGGEQRDQGSQTFAASTDGIGNVTLNRRIERSGLPHDAHVHLFEMRSNKLCHSCQSTGTGGASCKRTGECFHLRQNSGAAYELSKQHGGRFWLKGRGGSTAPPPLAGSVRLW